MVKWSIEITLIAAVRSSIRARCAQCCCLWAAGLWCCRKLEVSTLCALLLLLSGRWSVLRETKTIQGYTSAPGQTTCTDPIVTTLPPTTGACATHSYAQYCCGWLCLSEPAVRIPQRCRPHAMCVRHTICAVLLLLVVFGIGLCTYLLQCVTGIFCSVRSSPDRVRSSNPVQQIVRTSIVYSSIRTKHTYSSCCLLSVLHCRQIDRRTS